MKKTKHDDRNLLIWGIVLTFFFFPVGIPMLVVYFKRRKNTGSKRTDGSDGHRLVRNRVICSIYKVTGTNPKTGRRKGATVYTPQDTPFEKIGKLSDLKPPYELERIEPDRPSDAQLSYAFDLGIKVPSDATKLDLTYLISRALEEIEPDIHPADDRLIRYVISRGIYVPPYAGKAGLTRLYLSNITTREMLIFFCMRVYCNSRGASYRIIPEAPESLLKVCWDFAEAHLDDMDLLRSLSFYDEDDLPLDQCVRLRVLKAYEIALTHINYHLGVGNKVE